jgi:ABC-type transport system substrate-binding protein
VRRAEAIQAQLAEVGIKLELQPVELVKGVNAFFRNKEVAASNTRWTGRPDPDQTVRGLFHSTGFYNPGKYTNPRLEELMDQAAGTYKIEERRKLYWQIDELLHHEAVDVGLLRAGARGGLDGCQVTAEPAGKPMFGASGSRSNVARFSAAACSRSSAPGDRHRARLLAHPAPAR